MEDRDAARLRMDLIALSGQAQPFTDKPMTTRPRRHTVNHTHRPSGPRAGLNRPPDNERGPVGAAPAAPTGPLPSRPEDLSGSEKTRTFMSVPFCCSTLILTPAAGSFTPYCGLSANQ